MNWMELTWFAFHMLFHVYGTIRKTWWKFEKENALQFLFVQDSR